MIAKRHIKLSKQRFVVIPFKVKTGCKVQGTWIRLNNWQSQTFAQFVIYCPLREPRGRCNDLIASPVFRRTSIVFKEKKKSLKYFSLCSSSWLYGFENHYNERTKLTTSSDTLDGLFLWGQSPSTALFLWDLD